MKPWTPLDSEKPRDTSEQRAKALEGLSCIFGCNVGIRIVSFFLTPRDWDSGAYWFPTFFRLPCQTVEAFLDVFDAFAMTPSDHSVKPKICKHKVGKKSIDASKEEDWIKIRLMHERSFSNAHTPNQNSGYAMLKNPPQNTTHHKPLGINRHILR